jgi:hypothetical protein
LFVLLVVFLLRRVDEDAAVENVSVELGVASPVMILVALVVLGLCFLVVLVLLLDLGGALVLVLVLALVVVVVRVPVDALVRDVAPLEVLAVSRGVLIASSRWCL